MAEDMREEVARLVARLGWKESRVERLSEADHI
jgi:hypothetical protein